MVTFSVNRLISEDNPTAGRLEKAVLGITVKEFELNHVLRRFNQPNETFYTGVGFHPQEENCSG